PKERALINRLGFNNDGAETIANRLAELREHGGWPGIPVGINIGKSRVTPRERAVEDYLFSFRKLRAQPDYITLNVSSPNTPGLRELQGGQRLDELLRAINAERGNMPLLVKISPDLEPAALDEIVSVCEANNISGIIATNTTLDHSAIAHDEEGGLSGAPLQQKSTAIIRQITNKTKISIIGCGGILDVSSAREKLKPARSYYRFIPASFFAGRNLFKKSPASCPRRSQVEGGAPATPEPPVRLGPGSQELAPPQRARNIAVMGESEKGGDYYVALGCYFSGDCASSCALWVYRDCLGRGGNCEISLFPVPGCLPWCSLSLE